MARDRGGESPQRTPDELAAALRELDAETEPPVLSAHHQHRTSAHHARRARGPMRAHHSAHRHHAG